MTRRAPLRQRPPLVAISDRDAQLELELREAGTTIVKLPAHFYAFVVSLVGLVGIIVLSALHVAVPSVLSEVTIAALAAGAGLAYPSTPAA